MANVTVQPAAQDPWLITNLKVPAWFPSDTRSIVGAVLLAVGFSANMQITERIDTATVGGLIPWSGMIFGGIWFNTASIFYGLLGALIVATFNPIIAVLTATSPMAPAFFVINWAYNISFCLMVRAALSRSGSLRFSQYLAFTFLGNVFISIVTVPIWAFLVKLATAQVVGLALWMYAMSIPESLVGWWFLRSVVRSRILG